MSKLLKLKEWVTIPDAAKHLSTILEEEINVSDVLQLAVDGHVGLSVLLPNRAKALVGRVMPFKEVPRMELPLGVEPLDCPDGFPITPLVPGDRLTAETPFVHFESGVKTIDGLWDLAMIGNEKIDIENELQVRIGGPEIKLVCIGTYLKRDDGTWAMLQDRFEDRSITRPNGEVTVAKGAYYPAAGLSTNCTLVMRTSEIVRLQSQINQCQVDQTPAEQAESNDIDPTDLPVDLDAANMAYRAVSNGYGDTAETDRKRIVNYLREKYPDFAKDRINRIATVANPDKSTGRKKIGKE